MNPQQILLILRSRYKVALLVALVSAAVAMIVSLQLPKKYTADTSVMVDIRSADPIAAILLPSTVAASTLGTQMEIINSSRTTQKVVKMLRLDENPNVKEQWRAATEEKVKLEEWLGDLLKKGVKITPTRDSNVLTISFTGNDPAFAAAIANGFAQAYIETAIELKVEPARQYSRWFGDQAKVMRENVERAQARLSEYQRTTGIVGTDEAVDAELTKLNELSTRLTAVQAEIRDAQNKQRSGASATDVMPEVTQNMAVQNLRSNIVQLEVKMKEAAGNLGTKHPQYLRMELELAELRSKLETETSYARATITGGYASSTGVGRAKEAELKTVIEAQRKKLLERRNERDQIAVLLREVDTTKRAYEAVTNRFNQTSLESQATQTNVSVLTTAATPLLPSFPKPLPIMILMACGLGIVLGLGSAFGLEMLDRRIRSTADLAEMLQLPVIGTIVRARTPRRLAFWRRRTPLLAG